MSNEQIMHEQLPEASEVIPSQDTSLEPQVRESDSPAVSEESSDTQEPSKETPSAIFEESPFAVLFEQRDTLIEQPVSASESAEKPIKRKLRCFLSYLFHNKKLMLALAVVLLIGIIVYFIAFDGRNLLDYAIRYVRYSNDETQFSFDSHTSNCYTSFQNGLAVASVNNLVCFDDNGQERALIQNHADPPSMLQNGTTVMSYGVGNNTISVFHAGKNTSDTIEIPGTIIDSYLTSDSCICYSSVQSGYKTVLTALDKTGTEFYSWYSSTQFFSQCAANLKAKNIAAIALGQNGSTFESTCIIFETDREEPVASVSLGSDVIYSLGFVTNKRLCAVGETALYFFNLDGSDYTKYAFDGGELLFYNLEAAGFNVIIRDMNEAGSRFQITTLDNNGSEIAKTTFDEEILDISTNDRYLAVLTDDCVRVYDRHLHLCLRQDCIGYSTNICVQKDGSVLLIDGSSARRIR